MCVPAVIGDLETANVEAQTSVFLSDTTTSQVDISSQSIASGVAAVSAAAEAAVRKTSALAAIAGVVVAAAAEVSPAPLPTASNVPPRRRHVACLDGGAMRCIATLEASRSEEQGAHLQSQGAHLKSQSSPLVITSAQQCCSLQHQPPSQLQLTRNFTDIPALAKGVEGQTSSHKCTTRAFGQAGSLAAPQNPIFQLQRAVGTSFKPLQYSDPKRGHSQDGTQCKNRGCGWEFIDSDSQQGAEVESKDNDTLQERRSLAGHSNLRTKHRDKETFLEGMEVQQYFLHSAHIRAMEVAVAGTSAMKASHQTANASMCSHFGAVQLGPQEHEVTSCQSSTGPVMLSLLNIFEAMGVSEDAARIITQHLQSQKCNSRPLSRDVFSITVPGHADSQEFVTADVAVEFLELYASSCQTQDTKRAALSLANELEMLISEASET